MNPSCLQYELTAQEKAHFEEQGYLIVEDALDPEQIKILESEVDRVFEEKIHQGHQPNRLYTNFIPDSKEFLHLVDYEKILPKVWGILGWNIYLYHAHLGVTTPSGQPKDNKTFGWHQDSASVNYNVETHPRPRLSLKVAYFLTDVSEPDRGNFWIVPGSHLKDDLDIPNGVGQPEGAIPICVKPGTAVFFDRRLWHSGTPNWSTYTRKVLFYGYAYRWLRPKDEMTVQHLWAESSPIRKQLLGYTTSNNGYYQPQDADVPLHVWLREHCPESAK